MFRLKTDEDVRRYWIKVNVLFWGAIGAFTAYCVIWNLVH